MTTRHLLLLGGAFVISFSVVTAAYAGDSDGGSGGSERTEAPARPVITASKKAAMKFKPAPSAQSVLLNGEREHARLAAITGAAQQPPRLFTSASRGFSLAVPADARVEERNNGAQVALQSRRGYALNLQTADTNPKVSLKAMLGRLDQRYLGKGKPWSAKLSQRRFTVQGLPAIEAIYSGGSTKVQAVIARGAETDFVFLFFAPASHFQTFSNEFAWILDNFHPSLADLAPTAAEASAGDQSKPAKVMPASARTMGNAAASGTGNATATTRSFAAPGYGYIINYPTSWTVEKTKTYAAMFSGRKGTPAYDAIVSVQNVRAGKNQQNANAIQVLHSLERQLGHGAKNLTIVGEKKVVYDRDGVHIEGRQFVAEYEHDGSVFRKWALVLPRPEGGVTHVWSYTAPRKTFNTYRPVAESMLRSWTISEPKKGQS